MIANAFYTSKINDTLIHEDSKVGSRESMYDDRQETLIEEELGFVNIDAKYTDEINSPITRPSGFYDKRMN